MKHKSTAIQNQHLLVLGALKVDSQLHEHVWCITCFKKRVAALFPIYRDRVDQRITGHTYAASWEKLVCDDCGQKNENPNAERQLIDWSDRLRILYRFDGGRPRKHIRRARRKSS